MKYSVMVLFLICFITISEAQEKEGFFNYEWKEATGELMLEIPIKRLNEKFLYVNSLAAGVGSNDIGLDRGQLGEQRVVSFYRSGQKVLLIEENLKYRANSKNINEQKAVKEAFASSVVWGFPIKEQNQTSIKINLTNFLIRDAHGVSEKMNEKKQGQYKVDKSKSAIYTDGLLNFPFNSEFESIVTYTGNPKGEFIKSVAPTPNLVSVRQHHSFIKLPDNKYKPRVFKPECGYFPLSYFDYATPIDQDIKKQFIFRHRLEKKNSDAELSEAVEPITYYLDNGCPEPIRSALIDGAKWWNEAFEAAGFKNAFQVKVLPDNAHPLDVRYNMIQWVHRSTRGWSYGSSISDPRTGEILKGHVSLGSLRVRQDYLIAQGIVSSFNEESDDPRILEMALARLRQLSAHEIGHTIGLTHNFAASYNDRSSVMDYPHPYIELNNNKLDFSKAYGVGIGEWDKRAIIYGYSSTKENEDYYLNSLIEKNRKDGYKFITDQDARPAGGVHPTAHLWDNGKDAIGELSRMSILRNHVLAKIGKSSIPKGTPYSEIEKVLVPAYLMHRFQVEAVSKIIGGVDFTYDVKSEGAQKLHEHVPGKKQKKALGELLKTLDVSFLKMPKSLTESIPPLAFGYPRNRESFKGYTGFLLDPLAAAEASANHTITFLLEPKRLSRIYNHPDKNWNIGTYFNEIVNHIQLQKQEDINYGLMLEKLCFVHLLKIASNQKLNKQVAAMSLMKMKHFLVKSDNSHLSEYDAFQFSSHQLYMSELLKSYYDDASQIKLPEFMKMPPGSPIGCGH